MDARKRRYLAHMGIPVWQRRKAVPAGLPIVATLPSVAASLTPIDEPATPIDEPATGERTVGDARLAARSALPSAGPADAEAVPPDSAAASTLRPPSDFAAAAALRPAPDSAAAATLRPAPDSAAALWDALQAEVAACTRCVLHRGRKQTVFGVGRRDASLMIVGEAPGAEEDRQGEPFVGPAGQLLNAMLRSIGFAREDVFIANLLKCRPPNNRDPGPAEAAACAEYLERQIALIRPQAMLAVGRIAAQWLLQSETPIGRLRGAIHRYGDVPLVVTYHPAYLLRTPSAKAKSWQDLCMIRQLVHTQS